MSDSQHSVTPKQRFVAALERGEPSGLVPHFELVFYLTMEAFGKVHPSHRSYGQWNQMEGRERQLHLDDMADLYIATAERYDHDAIFLHPNPSSLEDTVQLIDTVRNKVSDRYFLMIHGDATYGVPSGDKMLDFAYQMADEPEKLKAKAEQMVVSALETAQKLAKHGGLDGFALCKDYCLNAGPFLSPTQFGEFVTPYLAKLVAGYRDLGFYTIKHTDGNINPIIDQLVETNPHALHSLDPQGDVDIAEVKRRYGNRLCLIGNVNCGLMDTGSDEEVIASARYALKHGMPGGGYIFSTSNCIYTGMPLRRYELILKVRREDGNYPEQPLFNSDQTPPGGHA